MTMDTVSTPAIVYSSDLSDGVAGPRPRVQGRGQTKPYSARNALRVALRLCFPISTFTVQYASECEDKNIAAERTHLAAGYHTQRHTHSPLILAATAHLHAGVLVTPPHPVLWRRTSDLPTPCPPCGVRCHAHLPLRSNPESGPGPARVEYATCTH